MATTTSTTTTTSPRTPGVTSTGCCPPFDPATFHEQEITWKAKPFLKERVHAVLHVPVDMGPKVTKAMRLAADAHALPERPLMVVDEISPWKDDVYIDVARLVPTGEMVTVSGTFLTRVYEGPYRDTPKWIEDMKSYCVTKDRPARKIYFGYVMCPACAKAYGRNYVILFAEVAPLPRAAQ